MTNNIVQLIKMIQLSLLFCTKVQTAESLQARHNACLETTFGYKAGINLTEEAEHLIGSTCTYGYKEFIRKKRVDLNGIDRMRCNFTIDVGNNALKNVLDRITRAFECVKDSEGTRPFYPYIIIGNRLFHACKERSFITISECTLVNTNFREGCGYIEYEVFAKKKVEVDQSKKEIVNNIFCAFCKCYTIKFAKNIITDIRNGKHYVLLHTESYLSLLDQNINRYRVDRYENGMISYYKSYFFEFIIINHYDKDQYTNKPNNFTAQTLETLRSTFSPYKDYIKDINTIEYHLNFEHFLTDLIQSLPILLWIDVENLIQQFESAGKYKAEITGLFDEVKDRYANKMAAFFAINGILGDVDELFQCFCPELRKRLNNEDGPSHVALDENEDAKRQSLFTVFVKNTMKLE